MSYLGVVIKTPQIILALCLIQISAFSQQFSVDLFFEDAIGNRDTVTIGYDSTATSSIDTSLGEVNIINVPWDTTFDVRITDNFFQSSYWGNDSVTYHSKRQILPIPCDTIGRPVEDLEFNILCKNWPITIRWDSLPFLQDPCLERSILTDFHPGGWFDVLDGTFIACYETTGKVETNGKNRSGYELNGDSIKYIFSALGDAERVSIFGGPCWTGIAELNQELNNSIVLVPNPVSTHLNIQIEDPSIQVENISVLDLNGRVLINSEVLNQIDISELCSGLYLVRIETVEGLEVVKQFTKLE